MFEQERAKLREWLPRQLSEYYDSGELQDQFAERVLAQVWWVLTPAMEERIEEARADGWQAGYDARRDAESD